MNPLYQVPSGKIKSLISAIAVFFFLPFLLYAVYNASALITRATGRPANITVNTQRTVGEIDNSFFRAFAQGGEESTDMLKPVLNDLQNLNPEIIRIDHIYDHYGVINGQPGQFTFDFSRLDQAIGTIIKSGAIPLFSLSYMPAAIAREGSIINPPVNWEDWATVVEKTIEHYSGKNNKNLKGIYYEVWNEPDLGQFGSWKTYGDKNYLTLYEFAARGAARADNTNPFRLGGPSTTGLYENWIVKLAQSNFRIDFFSWHLYDPDPKKPRQDTEKILSFLKPYPQHIIKPTLITEFGFTGNKDGRYQTQYAAAHQIATIRQLFDAPPRYLFTFQIKDGPNQETGSGWGLIGHENAGAIKKPRYWVFPFLEKISGRRLEVKGEGTWVTGYAAEDGNSLKLLLVNFGHDRYRLEQIPVRFAGLTQNSYNLKLDYLFESGCAADMPKGTAPPERVIAKDGQTSHTVCLPQQNAVIVELNPI